MSFKCKEFCIADSERIWYDCAAKTKATAQLKTVALYYFDKTIVDRK